MTDRQPGWFPTHVIVMLSASTAAYALLLAGVAGIQSRDEAAVAAARDPLALAVDGVVAGHDALGASLDRARAAYAAAAQAYVAAGGDLSALEGQLGDLAATVAAIDGVSRSIPSALHLPSVRATVSANRAPTTHGTTGASGK